MACGVTGYNREYETNPSGKKTVPISFWITGTSHSLSTEWKCTTTIKINPGNIERSFVSPTLYGATISLEKGNYQGSVDVDCNCVPLISGTGCFELARQAWVPSLAIKDGAQTKLTRPGQHTDGFYQAFSLSITDASTTVSPSTTTTESLSLFSSEGPRNHSIQTTSLNTENTARIEFQALEGYEKNDIDGTTEGLICILDYDQANYGGFGFHNVKVRNTGSVYVSTWSANLYFENASPTAQWSWGTGTIEQNGENGLLIIGANGLAPNQEVTFGIGGTYSGGNNQIQVECF